MAQYVARIEEKAKTYLLTNTQWEFDFVLTVDGEIAMNLEDAQEFLSPSQFEEIPWVDYKDEAGYMVGIPRSKKPKK